MDYPTCLVSLVLMTLYRMHLVLVTLYRMPLVLVTLYRMPSCLGDPLPYYFHLPCVDIAGQQYEELKKAKEDLKEEYSRERSHHKACKKECAALKAEYNNIRLKVATWVHTTFIQMVHMLWIMQ